MECPYQSIRPASLNNLSQAIHKLSEWNGSSISSSKTSIVPVCSSRDAITTFSISFSVRN